MSVERKLRFLRKNGIVLGTRLSNGRQIHMYMYRSLFAEIMFKNDDPTMDVESISTISGLDELNEKLENEIRLGK